MQTPQQVPQLIAGAAVPGDGQPIPVHDPSTGAVVAELAEATPHQVDSALSHARDVFDAGEWSARSVSDRQEVLYRAAELVRSHADDLAELETRCSGIPLGSTRRQILGGAGWLQYFGERIGSLSGEVHEQLPGATTLVRYEPRGVAALFSPWNVPVGLSLIKTAAALATGNSVVLKPSEQTPLAVLRAAELIHEAGVPGAALNVVNGLGPTTGAALAGGQIDCLSFTGGGAAGRVVAQQAAARLAPYTLELGGKSAFIVFNDADLDRALDAALLAIYGNNGQACLAGSRILLHQNIADEFTDLFVQRAQHIRVGNPFEASTEMGPLASEGHMHRVLAYLESARQEGDKILAGGNRREDLGPGYYIDPIVVRCSNPANRTAQEEIFGPFATLLTFADEQEAVRIANGTEYGLVAYLWTNDMPRTLRLQQSLQVGTVLVNAAMMREQNAPFGGYRDSGVGREGGAHSLRFYTQEKTVVLAHNWQTPAPLGKEPR